MEVFILCFFYQQKLGYGKVKSFIIATGFALISKILYNWMRVVPTYTDMRLTKTMKISMEAINNNEPILIFPENSDTGYYDVLKKI